MKLVLAVDKFKGSLSAHEVSRALSAGIHAIAPTARIHRVPVADGGDGTVAVALAAGYSAVDLVAAGPTGQPQPTTYARHGAQAVIELAASCGLQRLPAGEFHPWTASTRGLGEVIAHAVDHGAEQLVVGVGGSAGTDGGAGLLQALGAVVRTRPGGPARDGAIGLAEIEAVDVRAVRRRLAGVHLVIACDVDNPLLGPRGAAAAYGPQKGATPVDVVATEAALRHWSTALTAELRTDFSAVPGAGAGGGAGFGLLAAGGRIESGADLVLDLVGFDAALDGADLVITGEGALDVQTLAGKAVARVAARARNAGVPVVAVVGRCTLDTEQVRHLGLSRVYSLLDLEPDPARSVAEAQRLLNGVGRSIAAAPPMVSR